MRTATFLSLVAVMLFASSYAQETPAPPPAPAASTAATPARGATMDDVRTKFGAPAQETPAVGQPPITRWDYPGYVVFFEHDRVLHTVVKKES